MLKSGNLHINFLITNSVKFSNNKFSKIFPSLNVTLIAYVSPYWGVLFTDLCQFREKGAKLSIQFNEWYFGTNNIITRRRNFLYWDTPLIMTLELFLFLKAISRRRSKYASVNVLYTCSVFKVVCSYNTCRTHHIWAPRFLHYPC